LKILLDHGHLPFSSKHKTAFWKNCREGQDFLTADIFKPRHMLSAGDRIATAGSCFAQHIGSYVRKSDLNFVDVEPAPHGLATDIAKTYGFEMFSARYGNIYTPRQLRQLLSDAVTGEVHDAAVWEQDGAVFDGLRPGVEPDGYSSVRELKAHRRDHLARVHSIFEQTDIFIFTLGLTEIWQDSQTGLVFPTAPGVVAGKYDASAHSHKNLRFNEVMEDLDVALKLIREFAPDMQVLLTVSPVPLTATATDQHVLAATTYSKSVLRAAAEETMINHDFVDYFPSYELITGAPFSANAYSSNLRSVRRAAVDRVMSVFFGAHENLSKPDIGIEAEAGPMAAESNEMDEEDKLICEELRLEIFAGK
jgi:hypothetical protein